MNWDFLEYTFVENKISAYIAFLLILLLGIILRHLFSRIVSGILFRLIKKYSSGVSYERFLSLLSKPLGYLILVVCVYFAFDQLEFPRHWNLTHSKKFGLRMVLNRSYEIILVVIITRVLNRFADFFGLILAQRAAGTESKTDDMLVPFIKEAIKIVIVIISALYILGNVFNLNITSIIAGLGIGGLAFALAAKESLENLLGSFTIFLDKPFQVGDVVQFGPTIGTVERIGFRSTRIKTPEKSMLTVPNKKLVDAELDNLTLRPERRIRFFIGLSYNTTSSDLKKITEAIYNCIDQHPYTTREIKVVFNEFGKSALEILIEYYLTKIDYDTFLSVRQEINFRIKEIVETNNSSFVVLNEALTK